MHHHPLQRPLHFPPTHLPVPPTGSAGLMAGVPGVAAAAGHPPHHHRPVSLPHSLLGVPAPLPPRSIRPSSLSPVVVGGNADPAAAATSLATSMMPVSRLPAGAAAAYPILSPPLYAAGFNPNPFRAAAMAARVGGGSILSPPHLPGGAPPPHHFMPPFGGGAHIRTPMLPMLNPHADIPISLAAAAAAAFSLRAAPVSGGPPGIPLLPPPVQANPHQQNQLAVRQEDNFQFNHQVCNKNII